MLKARSSLGLIVPSRVAWPQLGAHEKVVPWAPVKDERRRRMERDDRVRRARDAEERHPVTAVMTMVEDVRSCLPCYCTELFGRNAPIVVSREGRREPERAKQRTM